jgi:uncharacterized membrane protein
VLVGVLAATGVTLLLGLPLIVQFYLNLGILGIVTNFVSYRQGSRILPGEVPPEPRSNAVTTIFLIAVLISFVGIVVDNLVVLQGTLQISALSFVLVLIHAGPERIVRSLVASCYNFATGWLIGMSRERNERNVRSGWWEKQRRVAAVGLRNGLVLVAFSVAASILSNVGADYYASVHSYLPMSSLLAIAVMSRYPSYVIGSLGNVFVGGRRRGAR